MYVYIDRYDVVKHYGNMVSFSIIHFGATGRQPQNSEIGRTEEFELGDQTALILVLDVLLPLIPGV